MRSVVDAFIARFGERPTWVVRAPGRVNLIGEHTDYNDGFVLPLAIDRAVHIALRARADGAVHLHSLDEAEPVTFRAEHPGRGGPAWGEYVKGAAWALEAQGHRLGGWEGVLSSDVPIGAGLSSSAALELATMRAFAVRSPLPWDASEMARLAQRAENEWVGVNCGIMDQMISAVGMEGHAVLIDCRSLATQPVPLPAATAVVILDTGTRRGLVDSAYNDRRAQCEAAATAFGVAALRDVSLDALLVRGRALAPRTFRRARHVVSENMRTLEAADAMRANDPVALGRLMNASHASLRDDFEVSSDALDAMVAVAQGEPACFGARMTGAGFGGCAVALVRAEDAAAFALAVGMAYQRRAGIAPQVYVSGARAGASLLEGDACT